VIVVAAVSQSATAAVIVRPLPLPAGFTVAPEGDHRLMTMGADGTVYAVANRIDTPYRTAAVRWRVENKAEFFVPISGPNDHFGGTYAPRIDSIVPSAGAPYVTVGRTHDGAYIGTQFEVDRWLGGRATALPLPVCLEVGYDSPHVYAIDHQWLALTLDPSSNSVGIDLSDPTSVERNLPKAFTVTPDRCRSLGNAILTGIRGDSVVGYLGYLDGKPAPWFINLIVQRMVALRWSNGRRRRLGFGVPFATTSGGTVVGATDLPGHAQESMTGNFFGPAGTYVFRTPHAVMWSSIGKETLLFGGDSRSIAWDVDEAGTIVGMIQGADGRHHAFRCKNGRIALLDDLPHPSGWRFESAYAVAADGSIAGIGTYRGVATAFIWHQ